MAKLIIKGELSQLLKIKKSYRLLEARKVVVCSFEENKDQEDGSSPESEALPEVVDQNQVVEEIEAKDESEEVNDEFDELAEILEDKEVKEVEQPEVNEHYKQEKVKAVKAPNKKAGRPARNK